MKVASGVNSPDEKEMKRLDKISMTNLLDQTKKVPISKNKIVQRKNLTANEMIKAVSVLEENAPELVEVRVVEMRQELGQLAKAMGKATYKTQLEALRHQYEELEVHIVSLQAYPVLWVQSSKLHRRLLKDLRKKLF